jgi:hypothetical protein
MDYERYKTGYADEFHGLNTFDYGYIGKFETQGDYEFHQNTHTYLNHTLSGWIQDATTTPQGVIFTPGNVNPLGAIFTTEYFKLLGAKQTSYGGYYVPDATLRYHVRK